MRIRYFTIGLFTLLGSTFAAPNLEGTQGLHRTQSAQTQGERKLSISLGYEGGTGSDIIKDETLTNYYAEGSPQSQHVKWLYTSTMNLGFALGIDNDWDAGVILPLHTDYIELEGPTPSNLKEAQNFGLGDLKFWTKHRLPITATSSPYQLALQLQGSLNTGDDRIGFIPKRRHMISKRSDQKVSPYTAGISTLGAGVSFSWLAERIGLPINVHGNFDFRSPTGLNISSVYLWGLGIEYLTNDWVNLFLEYSAETRFGQGPSADVHFITPGARFYFNDGWSFSIALDYNPTWDLHDAPVVLDYNLTDYEKTTYEMYPSHQFAMSAVLSYSFNIKKDSDKDGVYDKEDRCPNTSTLDKVDAFGCPFDTDKDGIIDRLDRCENTVFKAPIDSLGCALDTDKDGIIDYVDQCPDTPKGAPISPEGCPLDMDKDGIIDFYDQCANTPNGAPIDTLGCPLDDDKDGVINLYDKCPNTATGVQVNTLGCEPDSDQDGIPDYLDQCAHTIRGVKIDSVGCPINAKQDLSKLRKGIEFASGKAVLLKKSFATLDNVADLMIEFEHVTLEVQGHTDSQGKAESNLKLSKDRAQSVKDYLIKKGVPEGRLHAQGFGDTQPIADNKTSEGRTLNRRVELLPHQDVLEESNEQDL